MLTLMKPFTKPVEERVGQRKLIGVFRNHGAIELFAPQRASPQSD